MGIAAEDLPRLFDPFDRLGRESTDIEGTGIGLALSQRLVTGMGGRIQAESTAGCGSTFTLTMPMVRTTDGSP
jgi:signal transduction histidine kinase